MSTKFMMRSIDSIVAERKMRAVMRAQSVLKTDRTKFEELCEEFRSMCKGIRTMIGDPDFRGTYTEIKKLFDSEHMSRGDVSEIVARLSICDSECKSEAQKLGMIGSEWISDCWRAERLERARAARHSIR